MEKSVEVGTWFLLQFWYILWNFYNICLMKYFVVNIDFI